MTKKQEMVFKKPELLNFMMVDAYYQAIDEKKRELEILKQEILKYQDSCQHSVVMALDKEEKQFGFDVYEDYHYECVICGKKISLPKNSDSVISMINYDTNGISDLEKSRDMKRHVVKIKYQKVCENHPEYDNSEIIKAMQYEISGQKVLAKINK